MLLYTHPKAKANAPSAPDGTVIASTIGQVVASKDPARAIVYQAGGSIYRYVQGAFIADATKPSNYFGQVNCAPSGRFVTTSEFGTGMTGNYCSSQDAEGRWVTTLVPSPAASSVMSQVDDNLFIEMAAGRPCALRTGADNATATRVNLTTAARAALATKAALDLSVVAIGAHYQTGRLCVKKADGSYLEYDTGCRIGYNSGFDITGDGSLAVFCNADGTYVFERTGDTYTNIARLPVHYATAISNDGRVIVGVSANAPVVFYKRTGPATWEAYRTTTDKGASLSNGSAGCALDPDGRYAVAVIAGKGLVFYHTDV